MPQCLDQPLTASSGEDAFPAVPATPTLNQSQHNDLRQPLNTSRAAAPSHAPPSRNTSFNDLPGSRNTSFNDLEDLQSAAHRPACTTYIRPRRSAGSPGGQRSSPAGVRRRSQMTGMLRHHSFTAAHKTNDAANRAQLTYNSRSWAHTLSMWAIIVKGAFTSKNTILWPWLVINFFSVLLVVAGNVGVTDRVLRRIPSNLVEAFHVPMDVLVALGALMSLLLAFRLNVSYDRWWEARKHWGTIISGTRSLLTQLVAAGSHPSADQSLHQQHLRQAAGLCIAFAFSLKHHLLKSELPKLQSAQELAHNDLEGLVFLLPPKCLRALEESKHPPLHAIGRLREVTEACARSLGQSVGGGDFGAALVSVPLSLTTFHLTEQLVNAASGCERILRTPCPPGYVGVLRAVMFLWLVMLPICLASELGLSIAIAPVTAFLSFLVLAIEEIAVEIENPFGFETNDLPVDVYCLTVQADALRMLDENDSRDENSLQEESPSQ